MDRTLRSSTPPFENREGWGSLIEGIVKGGPASQQEVKQYEKHESDDQKREDRREEKPE